MDTVIHKQLHPGKTGFTFKRIENTRGYELRRFTTAYPMHFMKRVFPLRKNRLPCNDVVCAYLDLLTFLK